MNQKTFEKNAGIFAQVEGTGSKRTLKARLGSVGDGLCENYKFYRTFWGSCNYNLTLKKIFPHSS